MIGGPAARSLRAVTGGQLLYQGFHCFLNKPKGHHSPGGPCIIRVSPTERGLRGEQLLPARRRARFGSTAGLRCRDILEFFASLKTLHFSGRNHCSKIPDFRSKEDRPSPCECVALPGQTFDCRFQLLTRARSPIARRGGVPSRLGPCWLDLR